VDLLARSSVLVLALESVLELAALLAELVVPLAVVGLVVLLLSGQLSSFIRQQKPVLKVLLNEEV
jgi:hypothetical protein